MLIFRNFLQIMFLISILSIIITVSESKSSIYEVLRSHGLPMGILPNGVKNFSLNESGYFEAHLDRPCNAKFENEFHYELSISGIIKYGKIDGLIGMLTQDLFLWFPVKEIRVDIPSSGLIYFNVSVVSKQFPLSSFESPRDCTDNDNDNVRFIHYQIPFAVADHIKSILKKFKYLFVQDEFVGAVL